MASPYDKPSLKDEASSLVGAGMASLGIEKNRGYSKRIKTALIGIPETDEKTRMTEFKARYRRGSGIHGPGGGTTPGADGEDANMQGDGGLLDQGK